jgi:hypothetical protein
VVVLLLLLLLLLVAAVVGSSLAHLLRAQQQVDGRCGLQMARPDDMGEI